jgi:hypothetical protein
MCLIDKVVGGTHSECGQFTIKNNNNWQTIADRKDEGYQSSISTSEISRSNQIKSNQINYENENRYSLKERDHQTVPFLSMHQTTGLSIKDWIF